MEVTADTDIQEEEEECNVFGISLLADDFNVSSLRVFQNASTVVN